MRQKYDRFRSNSYSQYIPMDQLVQNVPDLGHIPILHTDQKHCNVFLDRIMPDIGHISKCVRSLFYPVRQKCARFRSNSCSQYIPMDQLVQNVPDLGQIRILHTDQKHCNVFLDRLMPDIGHISKCVRSLF